jgi:hypothetical protein
MNERFGFRARVWLVFLLIMVGLVAVIILPPLRQPQGYHQFADRRAVFGIPNFLNVASNGPLLLVGLMGLRFLAKKRRTNEPGGFIASSERWAYVVFFLGVTLTGFGSAYYHWRPSDSTLVWDRLPMTLTFMSLLAATITERIHVRLGVLESVRSHWRRQRLLLAADRRSLALCRRPVLFAFPHRPHDLAVSSAISAHR